MERPALRQADLALRRAIVTQRHGLGRGLWVLRAAAGTIFFAATILLALALIETFCCLMGERETIRRYAIMGVSHSLVWAAGGLVLSIPIGLGHTWLTARRDAMIADCHSARIELLNYLARPRC